jgi:putative SOS response-associated peptidase YedK
MCFSLEIELNIQKLSKLFNAQLSAKEFFYFAKQREINPKVFRRPENDGRLYPNYFAPVMVYENNQRIFKPMRYRLRPYGSKEEIPTKFNVFNARIDSLDKRKTWKNLIARNHGLVPFKRFFEWVEDENKKKKLISFKPNISPIENIMWAPCVFDLWKSYEDSNSYFYSFAIITDDPPNEILEAGHDRCPIFLNNSKIDSWLTTKNKIELFEILKYKEKAYFNHFDS